MHSAARMRSLTRPSRKSVSWIGIVLGMGNGTAVRAMTGKLSGRFSVKPIMSTQMGFRQPGSPVCNRRRDSVKIARGVPPMLFDESDRALVAGGGAGDVRPFAPLHRRYYDKIYRMAYLK